MKLFNPFYVFSLIFIAVLIIYQLNWSALYPSLTIELKVFLFISISMSLMFGLFFDEKIKNSDTIIRDVKFSWIKNCVVTFLFTITLIMEGIYSGGFPLLESGGVYKDFGIPTVHVLFFVSVYFYIVRMFENYLESGNKNFFLFSVLNTLPFILAVNRGLLVLYFLNCVFLFLKIRKPKISLNYFLGMMLIGIVFLFSFSIFGNVRMNKNYHYESNALDSTLILNVGDATESFRESSIPKSFFWTYLYSSSPLANLQNNLSTYENVVREPDLNSFFITQFFPDVISKRIVELDIQQPNRIRPELTVSTAFIDSFVIMGLPGMYIYLFIYLLFMSVIIYFSILYCKDYFNFNVSILCVIAVFQIFSNGLSYSVLSLQLLLPFIICLRKKIKFKK